MARIKLTVAYDGTEYCGWQVQPNGMTIQEKLQGAIEDLVGHKINLTGASRTDSGVHALCQVAVFDTDKKIELHKIPLAINQRLPKDIVVRGAEIVADDFHPRYCDTVKTYRYRVFNGRYPLPTVRLYSNFVYGDLDMDAMNEAAKALIGRHDFKSFCSMASDVEDTVREIYEAEFTKDGEMLTFKIRGNGFLHNMVRIIVGTLLKVGKGQIQASNMVNIIEACDRRKAGPTAPAVGLCLEEIEYL